MTSEIDSRIAWLREHVESFAELQDRTLRARADTEESRQRLGQYLKPKQQEQRAS